MSFMNKNKLQFPPLTNSCIHSYIIVEDLKVIRLVKGLQDLETSRNGSIWAESCCHKPQRNAQMPRACSLCTCA